MRDFKAELANMSDEEQTAFHNKWHNWLEEHPGAWDVDEEGNAYATTPKCPEEALYVANEQRKNTLRFWDALRTMKSMNLK